jgi:hypothetical protein
MKKLALFLVSLPAFAGANSGSYKWTINNAGVRQVVTSARPASDGTFGLAIMAAGFLLAGGRVPKGDGL